jgi:signal transduction histidine kinase
MSHSPADAPPAAPRSAHVARETRKFASVGRLVPGIAHEINTPTQYIGDNLRFLDTAFRELAALLPADAPARAAASPELAYLLEEIPSAIAQSLGGLAQVTQLVDAMKQFATASAHDASVVDVNRVVEEVVTVARNEWKYVAEVVCDLDPTSPRASFIEANLRQALLDFLVEAVCTVAAGGTDGRVTLSTRRAGDGVDVRVHVARSSCDATLRLLCADADPRGVASEVRA